ncbi:BRO family protein [Kozakia baliensis]|uniref:BRO family protein n=1 Tax=Kozakia baliensis TaxID=153496 RepID=UPI00068C3E94|nr:BRO family protein [Kozakia baliensis]
MATEPTVFQFENCEVIATLINGDPMFVASHVAAVLGYTDTDQAIRRHCKAAETYPVEMTGQVRNVKMIPERDVYRLILRSKLPTAEAFEEKVVGEILPAIRKTGGYNVQTQTREQQIANAFLLSQDVIREKDEQIAILTPKATVFDKCMDLDGLYGLQQSGRILQQKPNLFIRYLKTKWLFYQGGQLIPRSEFSMAGQQLFDVKWTVQNEKNIAQSFLTPKGLSYFARKLGVEIDMTQANPVPAPTHQTRLNIQH